MGAGVSQAKIKRRLRYLANKYVGVEFVVLYASNGEVAILPVNPETGEGECAHPAEFVMVRGRRALRGVSVVEL